jgi:hypothetical protein
MILKKNGYNYYRESKIETCIKHLGFISSIVSCQKVATTLDHEDSFFWWEKGVDRCCQLNAKRVFGSVVVVVFQSAFHSEKYANNIFLFFKNYF